jgi:hypothetical protein
MKILPMQRHVEHYEDGGIPVKGESATEEAVR